MKKMAMTSLAVLFFVHPSYAFKSIDINHDEDDCVEGWMSMDVDVRVDGERFSFNPSCRFSFFENFKTADGTDCRIEAGMCSAFLPRNKIVVDCRGSFA